MILFFLASLFIQHSVVKLELIHDPSLKPYENFSYTDDANKIKSQETNLDGIARIIFHRTLDQRKEIENYYNKFGETLKDFLSKSSLGDLDDLYGIILSNFQDILVKSLHKFITGKSEDELGEIEEILCANDNDMKNLIQEAYKTKYQVTVEDHLKMYNKNDVAYQDAMQKYCWPLRCQEKKMLREQAVNEAKVLQDIDIKKDKEKFKDELKEYLGKYSEPDLRLIFQIYRKDDNNGIDTVVNEVFEGDEERVYNMIVRYIEDTCKCYADELHETVKAFNKIFRVSRIIVTRSERDLMCVLKNFQARKGKTFTERLKKNVPTEGRYLESIRYLCGKP